MSNDDWVKLHKEMDITTRLLYWAQNEDMIDQYYTQRGQDLLEAEEEIQKLRKLCKELFDDFTKSTIQFNMDRLGNS
jgi:hypothetical protein